MTDNPALHRAPMGYGPAWSSGLVSVEESRIGTVRLGQTVPVEIDAIGGATMEGRVRDIASSSGPAARTYAVKLQLTRTPEDPILKTGFLGRASFPAEPREALVIPASALLRRGQLEGV
jgi:multidrug efflux pump subunit AcrA (membrane-fusion protein)